MLFFFCIYRKRYMQVKPSIVNIRAANRMTNQSIQNSMLSIIDLLRESYKYLSTVKGTKCSLPDRQSVIERKKHQLRVLLKNIEGVLEIYRILFNKLTKLNEQSNANEIQKLMGHFRDVHRLLAKLGKTHVSLRSDVKFIKRQLNYMMKVCEKQGRHRKEVSVLSSMVRPEE